MTTASEVLDNVGGAMLIGGTLVFRPFVQPWYSRWHATPAEATQTLPGDERVPQPQVQQTLAVTIQARAADVWPWLAQIGQERGGFYSYELLENIAHCQMHNAGSIHPEWELKVGDCVRLGPEGYPVNQVVGIERGKWLLLAGADFKTAVATLPEPGATQYVNYSWLFHLTEQADGSTRLLSRNRTDYAPHTFASRLTWEWITDPIGFVMLRKMLLTIQQRAESRTH